MPEHLETFTITLRDLHGHNTRNSYLPRIQKRKRNGAKEELTIGTLVTGQLF